MAFAVQAVLMRELRTESRQMVNYWLRLGGVAGMGALFLAVAYGQQLTGGTAGAKLFSHFNFTLFCGIWIIAPLLVADCISREKREGTLGLLFLTPLTSGSIVAGKSLIHALRAVTLFLALAPVLTLPFVFGGVNWKDALMALLVNSSALILAIAAGLLASSFATEWLRALALALALGACFALLHSIVFYLGSVQVFASHLAPGSSAALFPILRHLWNWPVADFVGSLAEFCADPSRRAVVWILTDRGHPRSLGNYSWSSVWAMFPPAAQWNWFLFAGGLALSSIAALGGAIAMAAWQVRRSWKDEPPSHQRQRVAKVIATPVLKRSVLRRLKNRALDRNPIGWLHGYSLGARLMRWGWCLLVVVFECLLVTDVDLSSLWSGQYWMACGLLASVAFSAAGSFRQEQRSGAMELLLVTPLKEAQIIFGRLGGIWSQFFPATLILAVAWLQLSQHARLFAHISSGVLDAWTEVVFPVIFVSSFFTLPVLGFFFSLRRMNFLLAWFLTIVLGLALPLPIYWIGISRWNLIEIVYAMTGLQAVTALAAGALLYRSLRGRSFMFHTN